MKSASRVLLLASAVIISLGAASAPAAFAQDKMGKEGTAKDTMSKDGMKKDDAMSKDGMKKDDAMSKDTMKKDEMKK
jgi:pentapeptide MXKDX repeat protein